MPDKSFIKSNSIDSHKKNWLFTPNKNIVIDGYKSLDPENHDMSHLIKIKNYKELKTRNRFLEGEVERLWGLIEYMLTTKKESNS